MKSFKTMFGIGFFKWTKISKILTDRNPAKLRKDIDCFKVNKKEI
jgi:hypothetical protein